MAKRLATRAYALGWKVSMLPASEGGGGMTAIQILRITRLCQKWGVTPAQAAVLSQLAFGEVTP